MTIYEAIKNFHKQFEYKPVVENGGKLRKYSKFVVCGMGGSNFAADLLKIRKPDLDIIAYRDYGLSPFSKSVSKDVLVIASSYSGNTEETISALKEAIKKKIPVAVISIGGKLLELAKKYKKPHIQMPDTGIQPRSAIGFNIKAVLALMSERAMLREIGNLSKLLKPYELERAGKALASKLLGHIPVIYSSVRNFGIAYNWKVRFNETGKIPAFVNLFPEVNHNEMTGFDVQDSTRELSKNFHFIFLKDVSDNPKIVKRMNITERLYRERGLPVEVVMLSGKNPFHKIFSSLVLADWASYYTALEYGVDPEQVPMVEEFKKLIK